ncbi:MAG TPA: TetR/AcrR family transcriptional regulator [Beutenbergiaceae bacterium]|nr:TetR/AcrR family transcriptional regulator [Beutenbergiaceae bacterium]
MTAAGELERRIYAAAMSLLRSGGPGAVTIEAVAAASGVARTTIYRRHKDRDEVLLAALTQHMADRLLEPHGDVWRDLIAVLDEARATFTDRSASGVFIALLTDQDSRTIELIREKLLRSRMARLVARLDQGVADGQLRADLDTTAAGDLLIGAAAARFAHSGYYPQGWAESVIATLRPALAAPPDAQ